MDASSEESTVVLIKPEDYLSQDGQVARLEDDHLVWVKGLEKIPEPPHWKPVVDTIPLSDVNSVEYRSMIAVAGMIGGLVLTLAGAGAVAAMIAGGFISFWLIGAAPVLVLGGAAFLLGGRRRRLTFSCKEGDLPWTSPALCFKDTAYTMIRVQKWAERHSIRATDFPDAMAILRGGK